MTVLVTGGAGYIGSHFVWQLVEKDEQVVVLDRLSSGFDWAVPPAAKLIIGDIGDASLVRSLLNEYAIDAVVHFAGSIVVPKSIAAPLTYYHNNTCKTRTLLDAVVEAKVRHFIFSSTAAVYGMHGLAPIAENYSGEPGVTIRSLKINDGMDASGCL